MRQNIDMRRLYHLLSQSHLVSSWLAGEIELPDSGGTVPKSIAFLLCLIEDGHFVGIHLPRLWE